MAPMDLTDVMFPHCDDAVLHAPGECEYCDARPEWQILRYAWGIAYTGHWPTGNQRSCLSDATRGMAGAHVWPGNRPVPPKATDKADG